MPFCLTDLCELCGCCMEVSCREEFGGCHTENGEDEEEEEDDEEKPWGPSLNR